MASSVRTLLVGPTENRNRWYLDVLLALALFFAVFAAYAVGVFEITGGVVFLAGQAAVVGVLAGVLIAYRGSGLLFAWLVAYTSLLGYNADHYFLGLSGRTFLETVGIFFQLDGLVFVGVEAIVLGTIAWVAGTLANRMVAVLRNRNTPASLE